MKIETEMYGRPSVDVVKVVVESEMLAPISVSASMEGRLEERVEDDSESTDFYFLS
ncbi:MAG: hypothetical protein LBH19_10535 [Dysgonamonadaceae bacterium]|jgi:hypothetical protein|nr:hypothetical protein [Dysgonamonadaceae bacterium]